MRSERNRLLQETDWTANSDVTMSAKMKTYRKALRDLPTHKNWPNLESSDWPTKPSQENKMPFIGTEPAVILGLVT